jgi:hypothetical protein
VYTKKAGREACLQTWRAIGNVEDSRPEKEKGEEGMANGRCVIRGRLVHDQSLVDSRVSAALTLFLYEFTKKRL